MKYMGGKYRIKNKVSNLLNEYRKDGQWYIEPFVGSGWILSEIEHGPNIATDACKPLIRLWQVLQRGWKPPNELSEERYEELKKGKGEPWERAFAGFGCSYSGKWFGGYARGEGRNFADEASRSLLKKIDKISNQTYFEHKDYRTIKPPHNSLIYCDPPYEDKTNYDALENEFDHDEFWDKIRHWSNFCDVYVSEYQAPNDFECVLEMDVTVTVSKDGEGQEATEKVFTKK